MNHSKIFTYVLAASTAAIAFLMIRYPVAAIEGSARGLAIWWNKVFPALFPFFVITELMVGFGVVNFAGVLMNPIMRSVFRLPGVGGFVFMMGLVSGFPAGARMTAQLYNEKKISRSEAERMASFTNFSNPLFLFGVTAVEFFHQETLGIIFALSHYIGNILVGIILRFFADEHRSSQPRVSSRSLFFRALDSMHQERVAQNQPIGKKIGDAVVASVNTLLAIGGFIALFSMIYCLLVRVGVIRQLGIALSGFFQLIGLTPALGPAIIPGLFELTIGVHQVAESSAPLVERIIVVCGLLGFCGFSIQAQAIAILARAGLSPRLFFIGRFIQMAASSITAVVLCFFLRPDQSAFIQSVPVLSQPLERLSSDASAGSPGITLFILLLFIAILTKRTFTGSRR